MLRGSVVFRRSAVRPNLLVDGIPTPRRETVAEPSALAGIARTHRLVIGHFTVGSLLTAGCTAIAIQVREPRARVLSLYRFWQAQPENERSSWGPWGTEVLSKSDLPLRDFLRSPSVWPAIENAIAFQALAHRSSQHPRVQAPDHLPALY